jgi:hypothetical protein
VPRIGRLKLAARPSSLRCVLCHDAIGAAGDGCPRCDVQFHAACARGLGTCPTLGCGRRLWPARPKRSFVAATRARWLLLLLLFPFVLLAIDGGAEPGAARVSSIATRWADMASANASLALAKRLKAAGDVERASVLLDDVERTMARIRADLRPEDAVDFCDPGAWAREVARDVSRTLPRPPEPPPRR